MATYFLGYASKNGLTILDEEGKVFHKIGAVKIGNMKVPDPDEMFAFIQTLGSEDIIVSPTGPNMSYLAGAFRKSAQGWWVNPARLTDCKGKKANVRELHELWQEHPEGIFYEFLEGDLQIIGLRQYYEAFLDVEKELFALTNAFSASARQMAEEFRYIAWPREDWVRRRAEADINSLRSVARRGGVKIDPGTIATFRQNKAEFYGTIYDICVQGVEGSNAKKKRDEAIDNFIKAGTEHIKLELQTRERELQRYLESLPHLGLFKDLVGVGPRTMAGALVHIGNPLYYPTAMHLNSKFGNRVIEGTGIRRSDPQNKEALRYDHQAHSIVCYIFGDKAHYHEGFFQLLYQAYKAHQYLVYWPLMELTEEMGPYLFEGKKPGDQDVQGWLERLTPLAKILPLFLNSPRAQNLLAKANTEPKWENLEKLLSARPGCGNAMMTPTRIENECKRMNGIILLRIVYYRWLKQLGQPLPIEGDYIYLKQCKSLGRDPGEYYDYYVPLYYYQQEVQRMHDAGKRIPEDVWEEKKFPNVLFAAQNRAL